VSVERDAASAITLGRCLRWPLHRRMGGPPKSLSRNFWETKECSPAKRPGLPGHTVAINANYVFQAPTWLIATIIYDETRNETQNTYEISASCFSQISLKKLIFSLFSRLVTWWYCLLTRDDSKIFTFVTKSTCFAYINKPPSLFSFTVWRELDCKAETYSYFFFTKTLCSTDIYIDF
jgi:hypothetical protein